MTRALCWSKYSMNDENAFRRQRNAAFHSSVWLAHLLCVSLSLSNDLKSSISFCLFVFIFLFSLSVWILFMFKYFHSIKQTDQNLASTSNVQTFSFVWRENCVVVAIFFFALSPYFQHKFCAGSSFFFLFSVFDLIFYLIIFRSLISNAVVCVSQ